VESVSDTERDDFHAFMDLLSMDALRAVEKGLDAAFPEPVIDSPAILATELLRYDFQFRAGRRDSVRWIRDYIASRKSQTPE
jgi:hypothetical protein